jgi:hypothetical protein
MRTFLRDCDPDFACYHEYCWNPTSKEQALKNARLAVTSNITAYKNIIAESGRNIPLAITEVQYTSAQQTGTNPTTNWSWDVDFITEWTNTFFDVCLEQEIHSMFLWLLLGFDNNYPVLRPPSQGLFRKPQYYAVKNYLYNTPPTPEPPPPEPPEPDPGVASLWRLDTGGGVDHMPLAILKKLYILRQRFINEEVHKKVHPIL